MLIRGYASCCKKIVDAKKVFDEMWERTVVSWNAVITACVENSYFEDALGYFVKMRDCGFDMDETTMVIMHSAFAELGFLTLGRLFHLQIIQRGLLLNIQLGTALVDMYAKSGDVRYASRVFKRMKEKNVWTWSAMILGFAQHGFAKEALELFTEMKRSSFIRPNYVTFLGVLCACSHAGLVDDGFRYFHEMEHVHGIKPMMNHYGAIVDILGRAGRLKDAYTFINKMPIEPDPVLWRTLLSACSVHSVTGTDDVGDNVKKRLLELEPRRAGNLVMVANMYAESGMWDRAASVRRFMKDGGLKKMAGESCLELNGSVYWFFSGYDSQFHFNDIYSLLDTLILHMKMISFS
ncbi:Pentatricopeptide repeat-containing protein [Hibiscus syriacus]|uniref:Pentatricopeptide repeat-containing protein n=2 Tax=Hibiscus syriacus TaxID=106335 RepID=A0A6A2Y130_HIBSY|nr:Pentatricopeptide repeat-containing protein [Hibiscus syriacus]